MIMYNVKYIVQYTLHIQVGMIGLVGKGKGVGVVFLARDSSSPVTLLPHYKQ